MKVTTLLLALVFGLHSDAQSQAPPMKTTTTAVLVDVTAVDKNGIPITDLEPGDFDLTEDGVHQQIASVTLVREGTDSHQVPHPRFERETGHHRRLQWAPHRQPLGSRRRCRA